MLPILLLVAAHASSPACDAPEVRAALSRDWAKMASGRDSLRGSEVRTWNLRDDGRPGDCLADFLARRPGAAVGGTIPFRIRPDADGFRLEARGEPRLNLLQADTGSPGR
jgi:hypothetical protein